MGKKSHFVLELLPYGYAYTVNLTPLGTINHNALLLAACLLNWKHCSHIFTATQQPNYLGVG